MRTNKTLQVQRVAARRMQTGESTANRSKQSV